MGDRRPETNQNVVSLTRLRCELDKGVWQPLPRNLVYAATELCPVDYKPQDPSVFKQWGSGRGSGFAVLSIVGVNMPVPNLVEFDVVDHQGRFVHHRLKGNIIDLF